MAANTAPIFSASPRSSIGAAMTSANTATDGTGTVTTLFTAGANGSFVSTIDVQALGTNVQTVLRIFVNNGSTNTTATNNALIRQVTIPATTASNTTQLPEFTVPIQRGLQAGYTLIATIGTAVSAGVICTTFGGDY